MLIAEIGLNHMGDIHKLKKLVSDLCETEVDAITLQVREESFYLKTEWKKFILEDEIYKDVSDYVRGKDKKFGMALSDKSKIELYSKFTDFFKILSKDVENDNILSAFNTTEKLCFLSTGNSGKKEIKRALKLISNSRLIHTRLNNCITSVNLKAISTMRKDFKKPVAFGNHCEQHEVLFAATAFNPTDYFFYVRDLSDKNIPPDYLHAIDINNVNYYCKKIKLLKLAVGDGKKEKSTNMIKGQE